MENHTEKEYEYVSLGGYRSGDSDHDGMHLQEENNGDKKKYSSSSSKVLRYQIAVTIALILTWLINGLRGSLDSTCLPDQRDRLGVTTQQISNVFAGLSVITAACGLGFSLTADMYKQHAILIMAVNISISAVLMVVIRFMTNFTAYVVLSVMFFGINIPVDLIGNAVVLRTWGERASGPMYAIHFGFGIGSSIGPFIARPFLSPEDSENCTMANILSGALNSTLNSTLIDRVIRSTDLVNNTLDNPIYSTLDNTSDTSCDMYDNSNENIFPSYTSRFPEGSRIELPYILVGGVFIAVAILLFSLYVIGPPDELKQRMNAVSSDSQSFKDVCHPKACSDGSIPWTMFFLVTFTLLYVSNCAREIAAGAYYVVYATESELGMTKDEAAVYNGLHNGFYMGGRLVSVVATRFFSVQVLTSFEVVIVCIMHIGWAIWGSTSRAAFIWFSFGISFFGSPLWPGIMAWMDRYIVVTSTVIFLMMVGASLGSLTNPIYGLLLQKGQYQNFLWLGAGAAFLLMLQFVVIQAVACKQGTRFREETKEITEDVQPLLDRVGDNNESDVEEV